ncbi:MAG: T9SS type A sorting domain-containing protein [Bacteroidales bacterium]|nr:T9SS type A sorting domain-containing protein [Bacteroidales bacterium]
MKKFTHFAMIFILMLCVHIANAASVEFPSIEKPGQAQAVSESTRWVLYNNLLEAEFIMSNGDLYFNGCEALQLDGGSEPFTITLGNGTIVKASEMTMSSQPVISTITGNSSAIKASEKYNGKVLTVKYTYSTLSLEWRAVLRDGSHYLRTELDITASANTAMTNIIPLTYNLTADADVVEVKGTVRGAPLASSKIFAGIENPDGINSVGSSSSSTTFSPTSWTPESWGTPSSVPSNIISLGFSSSQIQSAEGKVSISASGNVSFTFNYATGNHRLNTTGVDILDSNGNVVAKDYHIGYSGTAYSNKTYTLNVPSAGTYTLRYFAETKTETITSSGAISISGATVSIASSAEKTITGRWSRATTLKAGDTWHIGAVVGLVAEGQLRRSFLAYNERERAVPYRSFIHYNSWYELNIDRNNDSNPLNRMTEEQCLPVLDAWKANLFDKHNVGIDAFVWDDGWDDFNSLWDFHIGFPDGFSNINEKATSMGTGIGAWLGPVGGYGASKQQRLAYWNSTHSTQITNFELSNPEYLDEFAARCAQMVNDYDFRYFKLDGISDLGNATGPKIEEDVESFLNMLNVLRKIKYDLYFNCTVGTWSSPFWLHFADAIWRQDADWNSIGNQGDYREKWITYRDYMVYKNYPLASPICPINSIMTHGLMVTKYGPPNVMPRNDSDATAKGIIREMHCAFGCGSGLIELYVDNDLMSTIGEDGELWEALAECIVWHRENEDVLADAHWVGGNPWDGSTVNVYGWASWNGKKATLTLRNPSGSTKTFSTTLRQALDIPSFVSGKITLTDAFKNQTQYSGITGESIDIDETITFNMPAFDVVVLNGNCAEDIEISGSMTVSNLNGRSANIKITYNSLDYMSKGWLQVGQLKGWNGKSALTNEDIANMFVPIGDVNGENLVTWASSGKLSAKQYNWSNFATQTGNPVVLMIGNNASLKTATEIAIFKYTPDNQELLWENADGATINIASDNITPIFGNVTDKGSEKVIQTAPFTYPLGIEEESINAENFNIYTTNGELVIEGTDANDIITIYDLNGKIINKVTASGEKEQITISTKGIYVISISDNNSLIKSEKVIIK